MSLNRYFIISIIMTRIIIIIIITTVIIFIITFNLALKPNV